MKHKFNTIITGTEISLPPEIFQAIEGKQVSILIQTKQANRSLNQNAYYWGVVIPSIQAAIHDLGERLTLNETEDWLIDFLTSTNKDFVHLFLKNKFIDKIKVDAETGEILTTKISTANMTKEEFSLYLDRVIQFANQTLEIYIPEANQI